jgi:hypothetical protein
MAPLESMVTELILATSVAGLVIVPDPADTVFSSPAR